MTDFYSPNFTDEVPNGTILGVIAKPRVQATPGVGAALKTRFAIVDMTDATIAAADTVRMFTIKSGDRIRSMVINADETWTATACTMNCQAFEAGANHDGPGLVTVFESGGIDLESGVDNQTLSRHQDDAAGYFMTDRNQPIWLIMGRVNGGTGWTEDPFVDIDVVLSFVTVTSLTVQGKISLSCNYIAAGGG